MLLDLGTRLLTSLTYKGIPILHLWPSLVPIGLQLFKCDPNNEKQHFPPNLTSDDPLPCYVTFDLINIWRNPYCIFDPSLDVIGLQLFKGDPNNENLAKLEHTIHTHTHTHTQKEFAIANPPIAFQAKGIKKPNKQTKTKTKNKTKQTNKQNTKFTYREKRLSRKHTDLSYS